jgi:hypothetical protein
MGLNIRDVVEAKVIPWEGGVYGVRYRTSSGYEGDVRVGPRSEAEAMVRRLKLGQDNGTSHQMEDGTPFPQDIAAS